MRLSETALFLGRAALIDNRTVGEADCAAWHEVIGHLPLQDCLDALRAHRAAGPDWLMPSHIIARVTEVRSARLRAAGTPPIPSGLTHPQEKAWRQLWCSAVKDGSPTPIDDANEGLGIPPEIVPAPDPERLRKILEQRRPRDEQIA